MDTHSSWPAMCVCVMSGYGTSAGSTTQRRHSCFPARWARNAALDFAALNARLAGDIPLVVPASIF